MSTVWEVVSAFYVLVSGLSLLRHAGTDLIILTS